MRVHVAQPIDDGRRESKPTAFVNYRRSDSPSAARDVARAFQESFGRDRVFFDVENLEVGSSWPHELNERIPLSIARWHQHTNFCKAPAGQKAAYFGPNAKFGLLGSIHTREDCEAAGGVFFPHVFGWMVHVYPYESDPGKIWSVDDHDGHDNMDHDAMPDMKMD